MALATQNVPNASYFQAAWGCTESDEAKKYKSSLERRYDAIRTSILQRINSLKG